VRNRLNAKTPPFIGERAIHIGGFCAEALVGPSVHLSGLSATRFRAHHHNIYPSRGMDRDKEDSQLLLVPLTGPQRRRRPDGSILLLGFPYLFEQREKMSNQFDIGF
jgi:hypothetical protein